MNNIKKCSKCGRELPLDEFYKKKRKGSAVVYDCWCKDCNKVSNTKWRQNNIERIRETNARWRIDNYERIAMYCQNNKEKRDHQHAEWRKNNPQKCRAATAKWSKNNPDKCRAKCRKWHQNHKEERKTAISKWQRDNSEKYRAARARRNRERRVNDLNLKIKQNLRSAIYSALNGNIKSAHTVDLLGCSIECLRGHLERQFKSGMTWDNYGRGGWEVDHIIPVSYFDFTDKSQQKRCFHYTNLQPLWASDNIKKSNKIEERQLILL